jgi:hypothetical protein
VINLHKASVMIMMGRHEAAAAAAEIGAKEFQLSIQGVSISSAGSKALADTSPIEPPPPASHARLRHALSWIRGKQQQSPSPSSSSAAAAAAAVSTDSLADSDSVQALYNTGRSRDCDDDDVMVLGQAMLESR